MSSLHFHYSRGASDDACDDVCDGYSADSGDIRPASPHYLGLSTRQSSDGQFFHSSKT